jgi:hypothetical protein
MNIYTYDFEVQTMSTALMNAFGDIVIKRFNVNKDSRDRIKTRIVYAPKQRVLLDLLDKDQNLQLPVISVNIGGINRDDSRVFNKILGTYHTPTGSTASTHERGVLPVNVTYNISIMTRFQQDMDQILSHLLPYINPYFIISWRTPSRPDHEIRSKVMWDGSANVQYPIDQSSNQVARVVADLSFVFQGWLFQKSEEIENIYTFDTTYINAGNASFETLIDTPKNSLSTLQTISIDTVIYRAAPPQPKFIEPFSASIGQRSSITVWGAGLEAISNVYLSGAPISSISVTQNPFASSAELSATNPSFTAVKLLTSEWNSITDSSFVLTLPRTYNSGKLDIIVENIKGYGTLINNVPVNTSNPYTPGTSMYSAWIPVQLPYLSGFEVY